MKLILAARSLKATLVIDQAQLDGIEVPNGAGPVDFEVRLEDGRRVTGKLNPKTLRRAIATCREGPAAVIVQGKLSAGDVLAQAGLQAMAKQPKADAA